MLVGVLLNRRSPKEPIEIASASIDRRVFVAVEAEVALAHEEALQMIKLHRAEWPRITPVTTKQPAGLSWPRPSPPSWSPITTKAAANATGRGTSV